MASSRRIEPMLRPLSTRLLRGVLVCGIILGITYIMMVI